MTASSSKRCQKYLLSYHFCTRYISTSASARQVWLERESDISSELRGTGEKLDIRCELTMTSVRSQTMQNT